MQLFNVRIALALALNLSESRQYILTLRYSVIPPRTNRLCEDILRITISLVDSSQNFNNVTLGDSLTHAESFYVHNNNINPVPLVFTYQRM